MKMKKTTGGTEISMLYNISTVFSMMGKTFPKSRMLLPLYMLCRIAEPFMTAFIPSLAIRTITDGNIQYFIAAIISILVLFWTRQAIENISSMYLGHMRFYTTKNLFTRFLNKVMYTDYLNIEPQPKQKIVQRADNAVFFAQTLLNESVEFTIKIFGLFIYGSAVMVLDIRILLVTLVLFCFDVVLRNRAIKYDVMHWGEHIEVRRKSNYLERSSLDISAGKDIRIYQLKDCLHSHFDQLIAQEKEFQSKRSVRWYYPALSDGFIRVVRDILAYSILIGKVVSGEIDAAGFTLYLGLISCFTDWIYPLALSFYEMKNANTHFQDYQTFMNQPDTFRHSDKANINNNTDKTPDSVKNSTPPVIEFRDVSFCYENSDTPVLSHLDFKINAGEKIALVGNNGAGKTTLVKLLCGLYPSTEGEILIDGERIDTMNLDTWQEKISVVFQDADPMAFSVAMNMAGESEQILDRKRVEESLRRAGLWNKIKGLTNREDTYLTQELDDNGILLSGGEMQKLLLARSIYKDGSLLILDEPTSALDPLAESAMYEEYNSLAGGKTSLFISHRLASTKFCDRILLLEKGQIAEMGTHAQLMQKNGKYKEMFDIQSQYYRDEI